MAAFSGYELVWSILLQDEPKTIVRKSILMLKT